MKKRIDLDKNAVPKEKLRWICPEDVFWFGCTTDIEPLKEFNCIGISIHTYSSTIKYM